MGRMDQALTLTAAFLLVALSITSPCDARPPAGGTEPDGAMSVSDVESGRDETQDFLDRLADDRYVRKNGSAPFQKDPLQTKGTISLGKYTDNSNLVLEPWWVRWQEGGGGPAFDWKAACGSWIGSIGPFGEVLTCWLALHPQVAQHLVWEEVDPTSGAVTAKPYSAWTGEQKTQLNAAFYQAWAWLDGGLDWFGGEYLLDPPTNQITLLDCQEAVTGLTREQAWKLYLGTVAHSLALEIGGFVPWSIAGYAPVDLDVLLHAKSFFNAGKLEYFTKDCAGSEVSFIGYSVTADVLPAPATKTFEFLVEKDLIRPNHFDSVARLLTWARSHMLHIIGGRDAANMEAFYAYRGTAPASRVFEGTVYTDPYTSTVLGPAGFSPGGCHGVSYLFEAMMRVANLPVQPLRICGHRVPLFGTIGHTLSHGDDIYDGWAKVEPAFPAGLLLISNYTFNFWLAGSGGDCANIGRRPAEIARQLLPNELVQLYCDDEANGLSHADGTVYDTFDTWYDVPSLEAFGLWTKLATKAAQLGYCGSP